MKKIFTLIILLTSVFYTVGATNWNWLTSSETASYYVDKDSIQHTGQYYDRKSEFILKITNTDKKNTIIKYEIDLTYKTISIIEVWLYDADGNLTLHHTGNTTPKRINTPEEMKMYQLVYYSDNSEYGKLDKKIKYLFSIADNSIYGEQNFFIFPNFIFYGMNPMTKKEDSNYLIVSIIATRSPATVEFYNDDDSTVIGYYQVLQYNLTTKKYHIIADSDVTGIGPKENKLITGNELMIEPDKDIDSDIINKQIYESSMKYISEHTGTIQHANNFKERKIQ